MSGWKLVLPCTRAEAEALNGEIEALAMMDPPPVLMTHEPDPATPDSWEAHAYFEDRPDRASIALFQSLIPSANGLMPKPEKLPDEDWLTLSQQGLEPVHAGRFYVHTAANRGTPPAGATCFRIEASLAFGTGGHATTSGCLAMLDRLKRRGHVFANVADIGTGTGLLAFAALTLWPNARAIASDIDPASVRVAAENARDNDIATGALPGRLMLCEAAGMDHPDLFARAPFDLLIANILAEPLIELAPAFGEAVKPGGTVMLAGLLANQVNAVKRAYAASGFRLAEVSGDAEWPCLRLIRRANHGWKRPARASARTSQPPGDFGSW